MNTYTELIDNGIDKHTATRMLDDYKSKIGTMNGVYEITDIYYDFGVRGKVVTLKCTECGMIQRCYNKNCDAYKHYGGRGIAICKEWLDDRDKFIEWSLDNGYSSELTIDRENVNGNYEPSNCRWADWYTQANNRRPKEEWKPREKKFVYKGNKYHLYELCEMFSTSEPAIKYRMNKLGMTLEQALETPKKCNGRPRKQVV